MISSTDPEEVSHMLFGTGARLSGMFATHPPLTERIRALDPNFDENDYPQVDALLEPSAAPGAEAVTSGLAAGLASGTTVVFPETIAESVGHPEVEQVEYARRLRQAIPETLYDAAHSTELAVLLTLALVLDRSGDSLPRQFALIDDRMGEQNQERDQAHAEFSGDDGRSHRHEEKRQHGPCR